MPEGTSTARTGLPPLARPLIEALHRRARRPVEIAREARAEQRVDREIGGIERDGLERRDRAVPGRARPKPRRRAAPRRRPSSPSWTKNPLAFSSRAATKPSPPLLPGPHKTAMRPWRGASRLASSATAAPACSISSRPGVPPAIVRRSASPISALVSSSGADIIRRHAKALPAARAALPKLTKPAAGTQIWRRCVPPLFGRVVCSSAISTAHETL